MTEKSPVLGEKVMIRVRLGTKDAHYAGELVNGAKMLDYFGDVATELAIRLDGDEALFRTYEHVDFLAPCYAGDFCGVRWMDREGRKYFSSHVLRGMESDRAGKGAWLGSFSCEYSESPRSCWKSCRHRSNSEELPKRRAGRSF